MRKAYLSVLLVVGHLMTTTASEFYIHEFKKVILSEKFLAEGVAAGDINNDGCQDIIFGPYWSKGPDFKEHYEYREAKAFDPAGYSDNFLTYTYDFNSDGYMDILVIDTPGTAAYWYENPKDPTHITRWKKHLAFDVVDNENPAFGDIDGDGKPELIFNTDGRLGFARPDWQNPTNKWTFYPISPKGSWHKYTHGIGFGDINRDGRNDLIEVTGWWEQPASLKGSPIWVQHPVNLGEGAAQIDVYDVNGDGLPDLVNCLHPHKYGLAWFEQVNDNGAISFKKHLIMGEKPEDNPYGVKFTQMHAQILVDIDGDGIKDIVTGKRWWAHKPPTDPESDAPAVIYWFKTVRENNGSVTFIPYLIDDNSGVGMQIVAQDLNGDGLVDIAICNKKGAFVFIHRKLEVSKEEFLKRQPKLPGK